MLSKHEERKTEQTHKNIPIHTIIRPRPGNFTYNAKELNEMIDSIKYCKDIGCKGVVFGVLDQNNSIDYVKCSYIFYSQPVLGTFIQYAQ